MTGIPPAQLAQALALTKVYEALKRRLFEIAVWFATLVWLFSMVTTTGAVGKLGTTGYTLILARGSILLNTTTQPSITYSTFFFTCQWASHPPVWAPTFSQSPTLLYAGLPLWLIVVPSMAIMFSTRYRRRASNIPTCTSCGYNRAGIDAHAACPECGSVPPASKPAE